jgi:hypothetical protein
MEEPYRKGDSDFILALSLPGDTARWRLRVISAAKTYSVLRTFLST